MRHNRDDDKRKLWIRIVAAVIVVIMFVGIIFSSVRAYSMDMNILTLEDVCT